MKFNFLNPFKHNKKEVSEPEETESIEIYQQPELTPEQKLEQKCRGLEYDISHLRQELEQERKLTKAYRKDINREKSPYSAFFLALSRYDANLTFEHSNFGHSYYLLSFRPKIENLKGSPFLYKVPSNGHGAELDNDSVEIISSLIAAFPLSHFYLSQTHALLCRQYESVSHMNDIAGDMAKAQAELQGGVNIMLTANAYQNILKPTITAKSITDIRD